jgi:RNA polymerase sigma-32 factor
MFETDPRHLNDDEPAIEADKSAMACDTLRAYLNGVSAHPVLSGEEEYKLARLVCEQNDRQAAQKLVLSNLRLVVKMALQHYGAHLNILDVIQEGNMGLLHAVNKYSPYKGAKFSTYASFWIRAHILKYMLDSWSVVKVGTTEAQRKVFYGLNRERQKLEALGIYPSPKLLSSTLGVTEADVVEMSQRLSQNDLSLDTPLHDDSEDTILDTIGSGEDIEEIVCTNEESEMISQKFMEFKGKLSDKEAFIFDRRVLAEEPETLREIGARFKISRELVRRLEAKVMIRLKRSLEEDRVALGM